MYTHRLPTLLLSALLACALCAGCGYTFRGQQDAIPKDSVLGDGSKTLRILSVEQTTLYSWLPYTIRSVLRDSVTQRGLAKWTDSTSSNYTISANVTSCTITSNSDYSGASQLSTVSIVMNFTIRSRADNRVIWSSGSIGYSDTIEYESETEAVRLVLRECIQRGLDRLQQRF